MRIKNRWFAGGDEGAPARKSAAEQASAMAFIVWRLAVQSVKRMRAAHFEVDAGPAYLAFVREVLVFLAVVADRIAYARLGAEEREQFLVTLVRHLARHLQENADELLGPAPAGDAPHGERFIDLFNELAGHYAEFGGEPPAADADADAGFAPDFAPDFAFVRYLGSRLEPLVPEHDRRWVLDQVMAAEAPEAVQTVQRSMRELFDPAPRPARARGERRLSGE
jgi:hypothetical protein